MADTTQNKLPSGVKCKTMQTIAFEEHFTTPKFMESPGAPLKAQAKSAQSARANLLIDQLSDLDKRRIANMDAASINVQVLSLTAPGVEQLDASEAISLARESNDFLSDVCRRHPNRFLGFATLPTAAPEAAADELERMVSKHGFKGALVNGHTRGRYLDDAFFWPILERAESLQVPLYIHPAPPVQSVIQDLYIGNYAPAVANALATYAWDWHIETAIHVLRIILSGALDRYPNLQLIIGHLGETLPFMLPRFRALPPEMTKLNRPIEDYLRENIHYTFSGFNWTPAFLDLLLQVGADRIMFSTDYPYSSMEAARSFLEQLPISPTDRERIAHRNAERLLRL